NPHFPFADHHEWELAQFLVTSDLSMATINSSVFLKSPILKQLHLSFQTAKQLHAMVEILPQPP
ncbi:hypothetical protein EV363DRAFT_1083540, partial [Boletus edulis]